MNRMNRSLMAALSAVATVMIVFVIVGILGLTTLSSYMGSIGGMVGGVLGATYMQRFQDERFSQIMNQAARNVFVYLIILLPLSSVYVIQAGVISLEIVLALIFIPWMSALGIFFLSLVYYYRK